MAWSSKAHPVRDAAAARIHHRARIEPGTLDPADRPRSTTTSRPSARSSICSLRAPTIVCVQNGLYSEQLVKDLVGDRALVLRAITQVGGILVRPGCRRPHRARLHAARITPQSPAIAAVLTEAGLDGRISPDIKKEMWRKAVFNCVINPTTALLDSEVGSIVDPQLNSLKRADHRRVRGGRQADGVTLDEILSRTIDRLFAGARTIASMRQDLMKGARRRSIT
jgi:ketopantoate reductase